MDYTSHQLEAISLCLGNLDARKPLTVIGGYAGTGKTTILKEMYTKRPGGAIVAFMGKACDVLRRKGLPSQTIHSLIYKWNDLTEKFNLVEDLKGIDWIGADEGSMVGGSLWTDLESFGLPTVVLGDPFQLKPVNDTDIYLFDNCDYELTEIHRQAEDNPIIQLSMQIREGDEVNWRPFEKPRNSIFDALLDYDAIICAKNATRIAINTAIRQQMKCGKHTLVEGERINIQDVTLLRITLIVGQDILHRVVSGQKWHMSMNHLHAVAIGIISVIAILE